MLEGWLVCCSSIGCETNVDAATVSKLEMKLSMQSYKLCLEEVT